MLTFINNTLKYKIIKLLADNLAIRHNIILS